jgi:hypothetical protein
MSSRRLALSSRRLALSNRRLALGNRRLALSNLFCLKIIFFSFYPPVILFMIVHIRLQNVDD